MKVCLFGDLHLPRWKNVLQYDVLAWALSDIKEKNPDGVSFLGDVSADGDEEAYDLFLLRMKALGIPFLYIPGNSDLRSPLSRESIYRKTSPTKSTIGSVTFFALNDADGKVSEEALALLEEADRDSIVFLHHPLEEHEKGCTEALLAWRTRHPETMLFYAHLHRFTIEDTTVCLPALDPDKCIGEAPALVYFDTETRTFERSHFPISFPRDLFSYLGISCYRTSEQIPFAREQGLRFLELRPSCIKSDPEQLEAQIALWREAGGEGLSVHLPDVGYRDGAVYFEDGYDEVLAVARALRADRVTQHVPMVSVGEVERNPRVLEEICKAISEKLDTLPERITVGVENMHMTSRECTDANRRFGYTPMECLSFMEGLSSVSRHRVGINFDIGHARNNAPYSQTYPIATWLSMVGEHIIGYHIHQVTHECGVFENHMPITHVYGKLISYATLFKLWEMGRITKAPFILEMRPEGAYATTLATFREALEG